MSTPPQSTATGKFAPVGFDPADPIRTDGEVDLDNLSQEEREVVTADEFIVFGQANIEQWDDPEPGDESIYIEIDALEQNLDQLFALENISWKHGDVRVGDPLESYTLDDPTTVHLDRGDSLEFDAGDTLKTQVIREGEPLPDGSGEAEEDALWLLANLYGRNDPGGSRLSQSIRLGSYYGDLDGFSVTIDKLEVTPTDNGLRVHDVDFLAVTIGPDDLIKNPGSTYGVVSYELLFAGADDAHTTSIATGAMSAEDLGGSRNRLVNKTMRSIYRNLFGKGQQGLATEAIREAQETEVGLYEAAAEVAPDEADTDQIANVAEEQLEEIHERLEEEADKDRETLAAEVADDLGLDKEEVMAIFNELESEQGDDDDDEEEDVEEEQDGPSIENDRDLAEFIADVKDVPVDDVMAMLEGLDASGEGRTELLQEAIDEAVEERLDDDDGGSGSGSGSDIDTEQFVTEEQFNDFKESVDEQLGSLGEDVAESLSEQMQTGATPDPAGGNVTSEIDLEAEIDDLGEDLGAEVQ